MNLCSVAVIVIFSHDLRVYVFWIIVHFFIEECSAASSVNDYDKQITWPMNLVFFSCCNDKRLSTMLFYCIFVMDIRRRNAM